jgi:TatD DNase family protein
VQKKVLRQLLRLAGEVNKPVILHSRESQQDLLALLDEEKQGNWSGVVHCFSGTVDEARAFLNRGFYLGFTGVVTYRKADEARDAARITPLDRILVETDAPYLAPGPHRGKRNEPSYIPRIVEELARIHSLPVNEMASLTLANARRLFGA